MLHWLGFSAAHMAPQLASQVDRDGSGSLNFLELSGSFWFYLHRFLPKFAFFFFWGGGGAGSIWIMKLYEVHDFYIFLTLNLFAMVVWIETFFGC